MAATAAPSKRWLFGPTVDLLLGCGGLYALVFLAFGAAGAELRLRLPAALAPLLVVAFSMPHYAATLLRVYERRSERRRYALFAVHLTLVVAVLFVLGLYVPLLGVALVTLYLTWSPWHYSGQNYGLALMFLGRRGVAVDARTKRWIHASFVLSWILTVIVMHEAAAGLVDNGLGYAPVLAGEGAPVTFQPLGLPSAFVGLAVPAVGLAYLATLVVSAWRLRRRGSAADLAPSALLVCTQALWFSVPFACRHWGTSLGLDPLDPVLRTQYFLWIAVGHAVQYLWVSSYYARREAGWRGTGHYLGKTLVAGTAVWTLPLVAFAPWALGKLSYDAGLFLVLAAAINIHHFVLDGAIWKLRDQRVARTLLRGGAGEAEEPQAATRAFWRRAVWAVAGAGFVLALVFHVELIRYGASLSRQDFAAAAVSLDRLSWFGNDSEALRRNLARRLAEQGRTDEALRELKRGIAMRPTAAAYGAVAQLHEAREDWPAAADAWDAALALTPGRPEVLYRAGEAWLRAGETERARERFEGAVAARPDHAKSRRRLAETQLGPSAALAP